jgi:hypothetical protein
MNLLRGLAFATAACLVGTGASVIALPADILDTAVASYDFGSAASGSIPNGIQATGAPSALAIRGTGYQLSNGEIVWNQNLGNFTFTFPFDPSRGTFAETPGSFPNAFSSGGTMAVRLRIDPSVVTNLGQASSMGLITFRPDPDINIHRVTPRGIELKRDGPTDPLYFLVREGNNSIGYNNEFNDEVRSGPLTSPTADKTAIVTWNAQTLRIFVDGVLAGTTARVTADHPTPRYRIMAAVQPSLIHSGDNQFFKGAIKRYVLYNRVLSDLEISSLHAALSSNLPLPMAPRNLRITP